MPGHVVQLITVSRVFAGGMQLSEALGFPEVSVFSGPDQKWPVTLKARAKLILEDAEASPSRLVYRRRLQIAPQFGSVSVEFAPPAHSPDWQRALPLRFDYLHWTEDGELCQAFVPALQIMVFAPRAALLEERLRQHIRLKLFSLKKKVTLHDFVSATLVQELKLDSLDLHAQIKTTRQIAAKQSPEETQPSALKQVAEELPPVMAREEAKALAETHPLLPCAYEVEAQLQSLAEALGQARPRSVLLTGPAGCGKTALIRELARRRHEFGFGSTPFWSTSGPRLMTGQIGFGMWQSRCQQLCREVAKSRAILHLGNLGELLEVGRVTRGQQGVGSFLRPWIARGDILTIAECTPEQLGVLEREDPHLLASFQQLQIPEPTAEQTRAILDRVFQAAPGNAPEPAAAAVTAVAFERLHQLHLRYATYSANPGRPIRFLKNLLADRAPEKVFAEAEVVAAFSRETGLPRMLLDDQMSLDLAATREWFCHRVIGQPEAIDRVLDLLAMTKARLARPRKPLASLLFAGPTGTGKTELAKALAEFLFSDAARLTRFDLSEFSDPLAVQRLIGGPATGGADGLLTARVREQPFSVLLFDEFEKADASFFDLLLQILGDGRLTDAAGRVADFCNSVVVMTSNLGALGFQRGPTGFRASKELTPDAREHFTGAVQKFLRPEIFNRLDAIVPFRPLAPETVRAIAQRQIDLIAQRPGLRLRPLSLTVAPAVADFLAQRGYDVRYGARPLKRTIEQDLLLKLAEALNEYPDNLPLTGSATISNGAVQVQLRAEPGGRQPSGEIPGSPGQSTELASSITATRRRISAFQHGSAVSGLEDEQAMLTTLRRQRDAGQPDGSEKRHWGARLQRLNQCLAELTALRTRAEQLETDALSLIFRREVLDGALFSPELAPLHAEHRRLLREVFWLKERTPDDIVLALFSENHHFLFECAFAYFSLAVELGHVVALDYFQPPPGGRSKVTKPLRKPVSKPEKFFTEKDDMIGIVMHLRGDLFHARFRDEAGLHVLVAKNAEHLCLVQTPSADFAKYEPPKGIDRAGFITPRSAPRRRILDSNQHEINDSYTGNCYWSSSATILQGIRGPIEEWLQKLIEAVAD